MWLCVTIYNYICIPTGKVFYIWGDPFFNNLIIIEKKYTLYIQCGVDWSIFLRVYYQYEKENFWKIMLCFEKIFSNIYFSNKFPSTKQHNSI